MFDQNNGYKLFSNSSASFSSISKSIIDFLNLFSYSKVNEFIQSLNLVHLIFSFEIYLFVVKMAFDVNRGVLFVLAMPTLGFSNDSLDDHIAKGDPNYIFRDK